MPMLSPNQIISSIQGIELLPFPKKASTNSTMKNIDKWLLANAIKVSSDIGDEYNNHRYKNIKLNTKQKITIAERNDINVYLFGDIA